MNGRILRAGVSVAAASVLLAVVPFGAVLAAIGRANPWVWLAGVAAFLAGHYLNALKLRLLIGTDRVSASECLRAHYASLAANVGLPGLAGGDLVRAACLVPTAGAARVGMASVVDRVLDILVLLTLATVAVPFAGFPAGAAAVWRAGTWVLLGGAMIGVIVVACWRRLVRGVDPSTQAWLEYKTEPSTLATAAAISLVVQSAFVLTNASLAWSAGVQTGLAPWFVAWPLSKVVAVLPISLGGIGVREAALVSLLVPYGAPREAVLATGILWQGLLVLSGLGGLVVTAVLRPAPPAKARAASDSPP